MDAVKNFAKAVVFDGNYDASATEIDVIAGHGDRLPTAPFNAVWWNATDYPDPSDDPGVEVIRVTAKSTDTLTITRAQEGTAAGDHNVAGKTYALVAGMTAHTLTEMIGDPEAAVYPFIKVDLDNDNVIIASDSVSLGDVDGVGNNTNLVIDDNGSRIQMTGQIGTDQTASASGPVGTVVAKLPILDAAGDLVGYLPIYDSIT